jgi:flagellar biosynthesis/type III secretory pathway M-ring protein FliF/YscJ
MRFLPSSISDEQWFTFCNRLYLVAVIVAAIASLFIYHFGKKITRSTDEKIATANLAAQQAILKQKQADAEIERARQENLKLKIELEKQRKEAERRWHRITGGGIER